MSKHISEFTIKHRFAIAPMLKLTDYNCRAFYRILSKKAYFYTEMITDNAILRSKYSNKYISHSPSHNPVAVQLGGSNPYSLAKCTAIVTEAKFSSINLNIGCPSNRVQNNHIGACLMKKPKLAQEALRAIKQNTNLPVTAKIRIGVDDLDSYEYLYNFVTTILESNIDALIVHARKAFLTGISPKQNRSIPQLKYDYVFRLKEEFPNINISLNGGILSKSHKHNMELLKKVDGIMLGRDIYENPAELLKVDDIYYSNLSLRDSRLPKQDSLIPLSLLCNKINEFIPHIQAELARGVKLNVIVSSILNLFKGHKNAKLFRRYMSENAYKPKADINCLFDAINLIQQ